MQSRAFAQPGLLCISAIPDFSWSVAASSKHLFRFLISRVIKVTQSSTSQSGKFIRPRKRLLKPWLACNMASILPGYPANMMTVRFKCSGSVIDATNWSTASWAKRLPCESWLPKEYASSINKTPPCASVMASITLSFVWPRYDPCNSNPDRITTLLRPSNPKLWRKSAIFLATVVFPVPGFPTKT